MLLRLPSIAALTGCVLTSLEKAPPSSQLRNALKTSGRELGNINISKLPGTLNKLSTLLEKANGSDDTSKQRLYALVHRLNQTVLAPLQHAKQNPSFSVSADLRSHLDTLFNTLDTGIPKLSWPRRTFTKVNIRQVLDEANSNIDSALNAFDQHGVISINQDGECHLKLATHDEQSYQAKRDIAQPEAGPSSRSQGVLPSQAQRVINDCPRFRILLLGKSGTGKSSLINRVFGVASAKIAAHVPGQANINMEHTSDQNPYLVLHDSMGFESGSQDQYKIVEEFIQSRNKEPDLADNIHAVWLCTTTPVSGGRAFEAGDEQIFNLKLGNVPLVVVFTQYDTFVTRAKMAASRSGKFLDESQLTTQAENDYQRLCVEPLKDVYPKGKDLIFTRVSVSKGYEESLLDLIRVTREVLPPDARDQTPPDMGWRKIAGLNDTTPTPDAGAQKRQDHSTAGIALAIAQRVDQTAKIDTVIAVGRQRYWWGLASSFDFEGKKLVECVNVLHDDIILVWNFHDPNKCLMSNEFRTSMLKVAGGRQGSQGSAGSNPETGDPFEMMGVTIGSMIVGGVSTLMNFAKWVYQSYQRSPQVLQDLMTYIVGTTLVAQGLFWITDKKGAAARPVSEDLVRHVTTTYGESEERRLVHQKIEEFVGRAGILDMVNKARVFDMIAHLIRDHPFEPSTP